MTRKSFVAGFGCCVWLATLATAQPAGIAERRESAADVAAYIAAQASGATVRLREPDRSAGGETRVHLDRLGALAARLETQLRQGSEREGRETYREMRRVRLALIESTAREGAELREDDVRLFEQMMGELSRYYRGE